MPRLRRLLLILTAIALVWTAAVYATGGLHWRIGGVVLRSRDPIRALGTLLGLLAIQAFVFRRQLRAGLDRAAPRLRAAAPLVAAAAALLLGAHAVRFGSFVAGGSDPYGYLSQAFGWSSGRLPKADDLPLRLPFPSGDAMQAPLGYRAGPSPHTMVPTYAPGLPLMMALGIVTLGAVGPYVVVPVCAVILVWSTYLLGRRAGGSLVGAASAVLAASSPIVLFQSLWPMSDVPAAALWTAAGVAALGDSRRRALLAGACVALGLLVRPNLLILILVPLAAVASGAAARERLARAAIFALPVLPAAAAVALLNSRWFGSPLSSGYGRTADLYSLANVWPNMQRYAGWIWQSSPVWILLAFASLPLLARPGERRRAIGLAWGMFVVTAACYAAYAPFEEWWYLRFLLPGFAGLLAAVAAGAIWLARRLPPPWSHAAALSFVALSVGHSIAFARDHGMFGPLSAAERRYADVGSFVASLPADAAVFTMQHSGSIRFYGGRLTLRYDLLDRDWSARAVGEIERLGLHPYLAIDDWEAPYVRTAFGLPDDRPLPWPVVARMRENGGVTLYDMASRPAGGPPIALEPGTLAVDLAPKPLIVRPH